jgi:hypothetical protein
MKQSQQHFREYLKPCHSHLQLKMRVSMSDAHSGPFGAIAHWLGGVVVRVCCGG